MNWTKNQPIFKKVWILNSLTLIEKTFSDKTSAKFINGILSWFVEDDKSKYLLTLFVYI